MVRATLLALRPSHRADKKYDALFAVGSRQRVVSFGAAGYSDYTQHRNKRRRASYRARHAHDRLQDATSAGALSWHLLWGESTSLRANLQRYRARFGV